MVVVKWLQGQLCRKFPEVDIDICFPWIAGALLLPLRRFRFSPFRTPLSVLVDPLSPSRVPPQAPMHLLTESPTVPPIPAVSIRQESLPRERVL